MRLPIEQKQILRKSYKDCPLSFQTLMNREGNEPEKKTKEVSSWKTETKSLISWKSNKKEREEGEIISFKCSNSQER